MKTLTHTLRASCFALLVLAATASVQAQPIRKRPHLQDPDRAQTVLDVLGGGHILREAWRTTQKQFYRRDLNKLDWKAVLHRYEPEAEQARTPREVYAVINRMLGELKTSHLALMDSGVWERELAKEFQGKPSLRAGCELVLMDGRYHLAGVAEGGPAAQAGLLDGDEVLSLNGVAPGEYSLLVDAGHDPGLPGPPGFVLDVSSKQPVTLTVRRTADGAPETMTLNPRPFSLLEAVKNSVRVENVGGSRVGVIHLWHFMNMHIYRALTSALNNELQDIDSLVLDIRGRGGSAMVVSAILGLFSGRRARWSKPVVVLTDNHTRSAKEIFAFHWKLRNLGPIVGETTQGACIGCTFQELSDGSVLMIPRQDVRRLTRGENLEGKGVAPTQKVAQAPLPYRAGKDTILEAGLREARRLSRRAEAF